MGRSQDNCYMWSLIKDSQLTKCFLPKADEAKLWHQKLGHLNLRSMHKIVFEKAIVPDLKTIEGKICGDCQVGKQVKTSHKIAQHFTTSRALKLLHMDLMGQCRLRTLVERDCVCVCR